MRTGGTPAPGLLLDCREFLGELARADQQGLVARTMRGLARGSEILAGQRAIECVQLLGDLIDRAATDLFELGRLEDPEVLQPSRVELHGWVLAHVR